MKRTPLKRKTPMKRGCRIQRKPYRWAGRDDATREADRLAARIVHARGCCALAHKGAPHMDACGGPLEQHHARGRGKGFRWRTESHLLLCAWHHRNSPHLSAHGAPAAFRFWMENAHPEIVEMPSVPETAEQAVERLKKEAITCR